MAWPGDGEVAGIAAYVCASRHPSRRMPAVRVSRMPPPWHCERSEWEVDLYREATLWSRVCGERGVVGDAVQAHRGRPSPVACGERAPLRRPGPFRSPLLQRPHGRTTKRIQRRGSSTVTCNPQASTMSRRTVGACLVLKSIGSLHTATAGCASLQSATGRRPCRLGTAAATSEEMRWLSDSS
jgi:hypothetical protein